MIFGLNVHRDHMWSIRGGVDIWWGYTSDTFWGLYLTSGLNVHRDHVWSVRDGVDILCWVGDGGGGREGGDLGNLEILWNEIVFWFFLLDFFLKFLATLPLVLVFPVPEPVQRNAASTDFAPFCFWFISPASSWSYHCSWHSSQLLRGVVTAVDTEVNFSWSCHCSWHSGQLLLGVVIATDTVVKASCCQWKELCSKQQQHQKKKRKEKKTAPTNPSAAPLVFQRSSFTGSLLLADWQLAQSVSLSPALEHAAMLGVVTLTCFAFTLQQDWQLRASFFVAITSVASYVGWQSTQILKPLLQQVTPVTPLCNQLSVWVFRSWNCCYSR